MSEYFAKNIVSYAGKKLNLRRETCYTSAKSSFCTGKRVFCRQKTHSAPGNVYFGDEKLNLWEQLLLAKSKNTFAENNWQIFIVDY